MTNTPNKKSKQSPTAVTAALTIIAAILLGTVSFTVPAVGTFAIILALAAVVLSVLSLREE